MRKNKKYSIEEKEKIVKLVLEEHMSYREIERIYGVPRNTSFRWVTNFKQRGNVKPLRVKRQKGEIDYKEQYEILKKFQAFLKEQEKKK